MIGDFPFKPVFKGIHLTIVGYVIFIEVLTVVTNRYDIKVEELKNQNTTLA